MNSLQKVKTQRRDSNKNGGVMTRPLETWSKDTLTENGLKLVPNWHKPVGIIRKTAHLIGIS